MTHSPTRLRIRFTKSGDLRWISHRDLARLWERLLRRAGLNLTFSQGFHPKPKISFPSALSLGVEALDEVVELELMGDVSVAEVRERISRESPDAMEVKSVEIVTGKARHLGSTYQMAIPEEFLESTAQKIEDILREGKVSVVREGKSIECPVTDDYFELRLDGNQLIFTLPAASQVSQIQMASLRPNELLGRLDLEHLLTDGGKLRRVQVHLSQPPSPTREPKTVQ